jgi:hypothetical protein
MLGTMNERIKNISSFFTVTYGFEIAQQCSLIEMKNELKMKCKSSTVRLSIRVIVGNGLQLQPVLINFVINTCKK